MSLNIKKTLKENKGLMKVWRCIFPKQTISEIFNDKITTLSKNVKIDGFRKGFVPISIVEKYHGQDQLISSVEYLANKIINEIIDENKYDILVQPNISEIDEIQKDRDISLTLTFNLKPVIEDIDYNKLTIDIKTLKLNENEKNECIKNLMKESANFEEQTDANYITKDGDIAVINFTGRINNELMQNGKSEDYQLKLGSNTFIPGFEEQIIGHKINDNFFIKVKFPDNYNHKEIAGQEAEFEITINAIKTKNIPDILTEEFVKKNYYENIEDFQNEAVGKITQIYHRVTLDIFKKEFLKVYFSKYDLELPTDFVNKEIDARYTELVEKMEKSDVKEKIDEKKEKLKIKTQFTLQFKQYYLLNHLIKLFNIQIPNKEELERDIVDSSFYDKNQTIGLLQRIDKDSQFRRSVEVTIMENKVFNTLYDKVNKKIKELTKAEFDEYLKNNQNSNNEE